MSHFHDLLESEKFCRCGHSSDIHNWQTTYKWWLLLLAHVLRFMGRKYVFGIQSQFSERRQNVTIPISTQIPAHCRYELFNLSHRVPMDRR